MNTSGGTGRIGAAARRVLPRVFTRESAPLWVAIGAAAALATAFVAFGGLGSADRMPSPAAAGTEVRTSLYAVTVLDAELTDEVEDHAEADPGEDLLVMTLTIENLTTAPVGVIKVVEGVRTRLVDLRDPLLEIVDATPTDSARAWRPDGDAQIVLQPGVPADVRIAWPVPEKSFPDGIVRLDVHDAKEKGGRLIVAADDITWRRTESVARITVEATP